MNVGKQLRIFLVDGTPGNLLTAEIMNWTGHIVAAPRSDLAGLLKRVECKRTGIYIITGDDPDSLGGVLAYIGEGDNVAKRLYEHSRVEEKGGKDFWDRAIVITSKDANLTKAHARYLESRFIELAQQAGRVKLTNTTAPAPLALPEADMSDMEFFINQTKIILPIIGLNIFRALSTAITDSPSETTASFVESFSPIFQIHQKKEGILAHAQEVAGEFTVLEGSQARLTWFGSFDGYERLRAKLETDGTIAASEDGRSMFFTKNQVFASPGAAASVILGRSSSGREDWKLADGRETYGSWQNKRIEQVTSEEI